MVMLGVQTGSSYILYLYNTDQGYAYNLRDMIKEYFIDRALWQLDGLKKANELVMHGYPDNRRLKLCFYPRALDLLNSTKDFLVNASLSALVSEESYYKLRSAFAMSLLNNSVVYEIVMQSSLLSHYFRDDGNPFVEVGMVLYAPVGGEKALGGALEGVVHKGGGKGFPHEGKAGGGPKPINKPALPDLNNQGKNKVSPPKPFDKQRFANDPFKSNKDTFKSRVNKEHTGGEKFHQEPRQQFGRPGFDAVHSTGKAVAEQLGTFSPDAQVALVVVGGVGLTIFGLEMLNDINEQRPSVKQKRAEELVELNVKAQKELIDYKAQKKASLLDKELEVLKKVEEVNKTEQALKNLEKQNSSGLLSKVSEFIVGSGKK